MASVPPRFCADCGIPISRQAVLCRPCLHRGRWDRREAAEILRDPGTVIRFLKHVDKTSSARGCWLWKTRSNRYGSFRIGGSRGTFIGSHQASFMLFRGEITAGMNVLHTCDDKRCVNPDHLFLGTQQENIIDCLSKGRSTNAKLTAVQVAEIRSIHATHQISQAELARRFRVSRRTIGRIVDGKTWTFVEQ